MSDQRDDPAGTRREPKGATMPDSGGSIVIGVLGDDELRELALLSS